MDGGRARRWLGTPPLGHRPPLAARLAGVAADAAAVTAEAAGQQGPDRDGV